MRIYGNVQFFMTEAMLFLVNIDYYRGFLQFDRVFVQIQGRETHTNARESFLPARLSPGSRRLPLFDIGHAGNNIEKQNYLVNF
ncbi:MAG: hypothetical protein VB070_06775 [Clostridiaceae bacterium]|nr:hypothetical protein [Clostridiaceae bacterium]